MSVKKNSRREFRRNSEKNSWRRSKIKFRNNLFMNFRSDSLKTPEETTEAIFWQSSKGISTGIIGELTEGYPEGTKGGPPERFSKRSSEESHAETSETSELLQDPKGVIPLEPWQMFLEETRTI